MNNEVIANIRIKTGPSKNNKNIRKQSLRKLRFDTPMEKNKKKMMQIQLSIYKIDFK